MPTRLPSGPQLPVQHSLLALRRAVQTKQSRLEDVLDASRANMVEAF